MLSCPTASPLLRRQHRDLQPLETVHPAEYERRLSVQSTASLPSPSLVAALAYFLQQILPIGQNLDALQRRRSLFEVQRIPRRHSILAPSGGNSGQGTIDEPPRGQATQAQETALTASAVAKIKVEKDGNCSSSPVDVAEATQVQKELEYGVDGAWCPARLKVPFQFSHKNLRERETNFWGTQRLPMLGSTL
jgi:hypothetical protein